MAVAFDGEESPLVIRVEAELRALGFEVVTVEMPIGSSPHEGLVDAAREKGAAAAIRIIARDGRVSVWLADLGAGKVTLREEVVEAADPEDPAIALEAVELMRVGLMELASPTQVPGAEEPVVEPTAEERAPSPEPGKRTGMFALEVGPAVSAGGFKSPPMVNIALSVVAHPVPLLAVELLGVIPLVASSVESEAGDTSVHFGLVGGGLRLVFLDEDARLKPSVGAGFAAVFFKTNGRASEGFDGREDLVATGAPYLRGGLSLGLARRLRLRLDVAVGWALGGTVVRMDGDTVARFGQPFLSGMLAIEVLVW